MKNFHYFLVFCMIITLSSCFNGGSTLDKASSYKNCPCSFVLDTPVDYDRALGVGIWGAVYNEDGGKPKPTILWLNKTLYDKLKKNESTSDKIYRGLCLQCSYSSHAEIFFVYSAE